MHSFMGNNSVYMIYKTVFLSVVSTNNYKVLIYKRKSLISKIRLNNICSDLPNAFWKRKQHIVDLPYEDTFSEKLIPTKGRPIQMNADLEQHCRLEIRDLESKGLIQKS